MKDWDHVINLRILHISILNLQGGSHLTLTHSHLLQEAEFCFDFCGSVNILMRVDEKHLLKLSWYCVPLCSAAGGARICKLLFQQLHSLRARGRYTSRPAGPSPPSDRDIETKLAMTLHWLELDIFLCSQQYWVCCVLEGRQGQARHPNCSTAQHSTTCRFILPSCL